MADQKRLLRLMAEIVLDLASTQEEPSEAVRTLRAELKSLVDGRQDAWPEERRKATGERIKAMWEAKRAAKIAKPEFLLFTYGDLPPTPLPTKAHVVQASGLSAQTVAARLRTNHDGFALVVSGRVVGIIARDEEAMERIRQQPTQHGHEALSLPAKKPKRF